MPFESDPQHLCDYRPGIHMVLPVHQTLISVTFLGQFKQNYVPQCIGLGWFTLKCFICYGGVNHHSAAGRWNVATVKEPAETPQIRTGSEEESQISQGFQGKEKKDKKQLPSLVFN